MAERRRTSVKERIAFFQGKKIKCKECKSTLKYHRRSNGEWPQAISCPTCGRIICLRKKEYPAEGTSSRRDGGKKCRQKIKCKECKSILHYRRGSNGEWPDKILCPKCDREICLQRKECPDEGTSTKKAQSSPRGKIIYEDVEITSYRNRKEGILRYGRAESFNVPGNVSIGLQLVSLSDDDKGKEGVCVKEVRKDGYLSGKTHLRESILSHINGYPVTECSFKEVRDALLRKDPKIITFRIPTREDGVVEDDSASSDLSTNSTAAASTSTGNVSNTAGRLDAFAIMRSFRTKAGYAASLRFMRLIVRSIRKPGLDDLAAVESFANRLQSVSSILAIPSLGLGITVPKDVQMKTLKKPPQAELYQPTCILSPTEDTSHTLSKRIPTLLYCHGGGYALMSPKTHRYYLGQLASKAKIQILAIDYRKPPQNPYPAAVFDVVDAYRFLTDTVGLKPRQIVFGGDSAGGGLCVASLVALRDMQVALPAAGVLLSPWVDLNDVRRKSWKDNAGYDFITPDFAQILAKVYAGKHSLDAPGVSPINAELKGLPPLLMEIGDCECFRDMGLEFAKRATKAGVKVDMKKRDEMAHVFALWAKLGSVSGAAFDHVCSFIERHVQRTPT